MSSAENAIESGEEKVSYRFRLRDLLGFITLCGLQFAIVTWIGALYGVLVGLGIALLVFSGFFLRGLVVGIREVADYRDGRSATPPRVRAKEQRNLILLTFAAYFMMGATLLTGGGIVVNNVAGDWMIRREMSQKCGFTFKAYSSPLSKGGSVDVIDVLTVTSDGAFDKSGIRKGDVIYASGGTSKFFRETLYANRGKPVTLDVRKWKLNTTIDLAPSNERIVNIPR